MTDQQLSPALKAFDAVAPVFDARFGAWLSVDAQRAAVRRALLSSLPPGGRILELGGGTGDGCDLACQTGVRSHATRMVLRPWLRLRKRSSRILGSRATAAPLEELEAFGERHVSSNGASCSTAPSPISRRLTASTISDLLGAASQSCSAPALPPCWFCSEPCRRARCSSKRCAAARASPSAAFTRGPVPARLAGQAFNVTYHRRVALRDAMQPWFRLVRTVGIGIFVPPSAAEPWISRHSGLLRLLAALDRSSERALARFADHVLYHFERTDAAAP